MPFLNDLLPPIVPDILPAFVGTTTKIYFSVNDAENLTLAQVGINTIQYRVTDQKNGYIPEEELGEDMGFRWGGYCWPCTEKEDLQYGDHYIIIDTSTLIPYNYYKIQLRVSHKNPDYFRESNYSLEDLSEWSSVCLFKKIEQPEITFSDFSKQKNGGTLWKTNFSGVIKGFFKFTSSSETLKMSKIQIRKKLNNGISSPVFESNYIIPKSTNHFQFDITKDLQDGTYYDIYLFYITSSGYKRAYYRGNILFNSFGSGSNPAIVQLQSVPDTGKMQVRIVIKSSEHYQGNFIIRRTSAESGFTKWENIKIIQFISDGIYSNVETVQSGNDSVKIFTWEDKTIESGMYYKYGVAPLRQGGWKGDFVSSATSEMCLFDDIYLMSGDKQLRAKFNPNISNFKYNVSENIQTTLGSKYPFVKRNGSNYYRSFTIGGLITTYMDTSQDNILQLNQDSLISRNEDSHVVYQASSVFGKTNIKIQPEQLKDFTSKEELYDYGYDYSSNLDNAPSTKMNIFNQSHNVEQYEDIIYEREFREAVYDFLYKNTIKLFRSGTEGNMLIKLTNITFTPIASLGRQLYSFSAEAIEIANCSIANYEKYNIQKIGQYKDIPAITYENIAGQIIGNFNSSINIIDTIKDKYEKEWRYLSSNEIQKVSKKQDYYDIKIKKFSKIHIEISSQPHPIAMASINNGETKYFYTKNKGRHQKNPPILGYLIKINNNTHIIKANIQRRKDGQYSYIGTYEISGDFSDLTELSFINSSASINLGNIAAQIDYLVDIEAVPHEVTIVEAQSFTKAGQLIGTFSPNKSVFKEIQEQENYSHTNRVLKNGKTKKWVSYSREMVNLFAINFQANNGAVLYLKTTNFSGTSDPDYSKHILSNGYINFSNINRNESISVKDFYFKGIFLAKSSKNDYIIGSNEAYPEPRHNQYRLCLTDLHGENVVFKNLQAIKNPIPNGVYATYSKQTVAIKKEGKELIVQNSSIQDRTLKVSKKIEYYIYYNMKWEPFDLNEQIVLKKVDAIINYSCDIEKNIYELLRK